MRGVACLALVSVYHCHLVHYVWAFGTVQMKKVLIAPCMSDSPVQCSARSHVFAIQATCCNQFAVQASSVALSIHRCMLLCVTGVFAMHARLLSACRPK